MIKFRPSLTLDEIQFILTHPHISTQPDLATKLSTFVLKATHGLVKPSHVKLRSPTLESAGLASTSPNQIDSLMELYKLNPSILTPSQLDQINHHRYINDMMTTEEEAEYERAGF